MQPESLDVLEKADASPALARAIVRAIEIETSAGRDAAATKHDLSVLGTALRTEMGELRTGLRAEMGDLRTGLHAEMGDLRTGLHAEMGELRTELRAEMEDLRTELRAEMGDLRTELRQLGTELRAQMGTFATQAELANLRGDLKGEIHQAVSVLARQMYLAVLGQTAVMLGFTYFLVMELRPLT